MGSGNENGRSLDLGLIGHILVSLDMICDAPTSGLPGVSTHPHIMCWELVAQTCIVICVFEGHIQISLADGLVVHGRMVLSEIVCLVGALRHQKMWNWP